MSTDEKSSAADLMADNDRLIAEFLEAADKFAETIDQIKERERIAHESLMAELKRETPDAR